MKLVTLLFAALFYTSAYAETAYFLSSGHTFVNTDSDVIETSIRYGRWEGSVGHISESEYWYGGKMESSNYASVTRLIDREDGGLFYRAGIAYTPKHRELMSPVNFRLGIGYELRGLEIEYSHFSNAGTSHPNFGLDQIQFRYPLVWSW